MARHLVGFAALAMGISISETTAQEFPPACSNSNSLSIPIASQSDLYTLLDNGCTTLYGQLRIQSSFDGEFVLPNVTTIKVDGILVEGDGGDSRLTAIELPDLVEVSNSIQLGTLGKVRRVSMPKLKTIPGNLSGKLWVEGARVGFGALESVRGVDLVGNLTRLDFPSLRSVNKTISICNVPDCDIDYRVAETTMDLSFPALESAGVFDIKGTVSRIFAPNLTAVGMLPMVFPTAGNATNMTNSTNSTSLTNTTNTASTSNLESRSSIDGQQDVVQGLNLHLENVPLNISFPSLVNVTPSANFKGPLLSLNLPNMTTYPENFTVYTSESARIALPVIHAQNLEFQGSMESLNLTHLHKPFTLTVYSDTSIDCASITIPGDAQSLPNVYCSDFDSTYTYSHYSKPGLNTWQKVVIAVGVIVAVALGVFVGVLCWRRRKARRGLRVGLVWRPGSVAGWRRRKDSTDSESDADSGLGKEMDGMVQAGRRGSPPPYPPRPSRPEGV
ncbi:hypothetical protein BJY00DRAFT_208811 [Aspergillus carlsbadensis]|nr:hypothetical protein BJY00DRAFT_208811 [Aspergillus carlsbadensis]